MALFLPDRFIARSLAQFETGYRTVSAWYWHLHGTGHADVESDRWSQSLGALGAMDWIAGKSPFPPAYSAMLDRTRSNLWRLSAYTIMIADHEGEELDRLDPHADAMQEHVWAGAGAVYRWAIGVTDHLPGDDMLPEEVRAARLHYQVEIQKQRGRQVA